MSNSELNIPSAVGSYLLVFYLRRGTELVIGRLGRFSFARGWYLYAGSAFGPGGLKARVGHHLKPLQRCHWHVDYLRTVAELRSVYFQTGINNEHLWSERLSALPEACFPVRGFGASDCRCLSHLAYLPRRQKPGKLRLYLDSSGRVSRLNLAGD